MVSAAFPWRPFNLRENVWLIGQEVANNRSLVGFQLWIDKTSYSPTNSGGKAHRWMNVNGGRVAEYFGNGFDFRNGTNFLLHQGEVWIPHNADGTKTFTVEAAADFDILGATSLATGAIGLATIPRASTSVWAVPGDIEAGQTKQINTNRASTSFHHDIYWQVGDASGTVATGVLDSVNWTPPLSVMNQFPNSTYRDGIFRTETWSGGTHIGTTYSWYRVYAPASIVPTISGAITSTEGTTGVAANVGKFVQGVSKFVAGIGTSAGAYGSTIANPSGYKIEILKGTTLLHTINGPSGTSPVITESGTLTVKGTVTDSRGRTATKSITVDVLPWAPPVLNAVSVQRALSTGVANEEGTYLRVNINAAVTSLLNTTQRNAINFRISTRLRDTTTWTIKVNTAPGGLTYNNYQLFSGYPVDQSFEVLVEVYDDFATSAVAHTLATARIFMHWGNQTAGEGIGLLKFWEDGAVDVAGDLYLKAGINGMLGALHPAPGSHGVVTDRLPHSGTSGQRDAYYGVPATDSARVLLANRKVLWFNTDKGWLESYYAVTGLAGLTATGLVATTPSGWYPVGTGPRAVVRMAAAQGHSNGTVPNNWSFTVEGAYRRGGTDWFDLFNNSTTFRALKAGRYRFEGVMSYPNGSGTGVASWRGNIPGNPIQFPVPLLSGYGQYTLHAIADASMGPEFGVYYQTDAASWTIGGLNSYMSLEYLGPRLVTE